MFQKSYKGPSAPAQHAARIVLRNFDIVEKPESRIRATERNLALLIDLCTDIFRVQDVIDDFVKNTPWLSKHDLARNLEQLREGVRAIELVRNRLPRYVDETQTPVHVRRGVEREVSRQVQEEIGQLSKALSAARTMEEERKVLRAAGIVK